MPNYSDRTPLQIVGGIESVRAALTLGMRELFIVVDGAGAPTGKVYAGDGSTAGGVLLGDGADHGSLAGLADDDHSQYAKTDGSRAITGLQTFNAGLTSTAGTSTFGLWQSTGNGSISKNTPALTLFNSIAANTDGSRNASLLAGGLTGASALHYLSEIETEHDGTAADQLGRMIVRLNLLTSGLGAMKEALRLDQFGLKTFGHELGDYYISPSSQSVAVASGWVKLTGWATGRQDASFTIASDTVTANYTGWVRIGYSLSAESSGSGTTRSEAEWRMTQEGAEIAATRRQTQHVSITSASLIGRASCSAERTIAVTTGDEFEVEGDAIGAAAILPKYMSWTFQRVQQP